MKRKIWIKHGKQFLALLCAATLLCMDGGTVSAAAAGLTENNVIGESAASVERAHTDNFGAALQLRQEEEPQLGYERDVSDGYVETTGIVEESLGASDITWNYSDGRLVISGSGKLEYANGNVPWKNERYNITEVEIGNGITEIGEAVFYGHSCLTKVTIPSSVTGIGQGAFANCYCLTELNGGTGIVNIEDYAFQSCAFTEFTVPRGVKSLDNLVFFDCRQLTNYKVASGNTVYRAIDGVLYADSGKTLAMYPAGRTAAAYQLPDSVGKISDYAMMGAAIQKVVLPGGLKTIGESAFQQAELTELILPDQVNSVGDFTCYECRKLEKVVIGDGLKKLGYQMFEKCSSLKNVDLGKVTDLDYLAFAYCSSLQSIAIPSGVTIIQNGTFGECSGLVNVTLPSTVTEIAYQAFLNCSSLKTIVLPKKLKAVYRYAFYGCTSLAAVALPATIEEIGEHAFPETTRLTGRPSGMVKMEDGSYQMVVQVRISVSECYKMAYEVLALVNKERKAQGLPGLTMDKSLSETAMMRAAESCIYWSHTRPSGQDCFTANSLMCAENIAVGQASAASVMNSWMNSAGHRANILASESKTIGIGCVKKDGVYYWVQCFGTTISSAAKQPSYATKNRSRTVYVNRDKEYYRPAILFSAGSVKETKTLKITVSWYNGFTSVSIPASSLKYKSTDTTVAVAKSGKIQGIEEGNCKVSVWFAGNEAAKVTKKITVKPLVARGKIITAGKYRYQALGYSRMAFAGLGKKTVSKVVIPKTVTYGGKTYKITAIADKALKNTKVTEVTIGSNVTSIGREAFRGCNELRSITVKTSVLDKVGKNAFKGIKSTAKIKVPSKKLVAYKKLLKNKGQGKNVKITK